MSEPVWVPLGATGLNPPPITPPDEGKWLHALGGVMIWDTIPLPATAIPVAIADVKGDLIAASGPDVVARLPVGANGEVLTADSTQALGLKYGPAASGVPVGSLISYAGAAAPTGFLLCDGTGISTTTYAALFAAIGYAYGGSGGTFNVPDLRGRVAVGKGTHADVDALADNDGAALADRRPKHRHTVNDPTHAHGVSDPTHAHGFTAAANGGGPNAYGGGGFAVNNQALVTAGAATGISISGNATGVTVGLQTATPVDAPAFIVVNYIIKT